MEVTRVPACNQRHLIGQRCARWLLSMQDRVGNDLPLTHERVSLMIGVRRATVTEMLQRFEHERLIECRRGHILIRDRAGLLALSCECYRVVTSSVSRLWRSADPFR